MNGPYTVGELAKRAGLTVRTLHHYEQLGLLRPSGRSEAGYRRYGEADVLRLHRVLALRDAGLALKDIVPLLDSQAPPPLAELLATQITQLEAELLTREHLLQTLRNAARRLQFQGDGGDAVQVLLDVMALRRVQERHFSPEQLRAMRRRWEALPEAERDAVEAEWPQLIRQAQAALDAGTDPAAPAVQQIVRRWRALQQRFMELVPEGMSAHVQRMYEQEPEIARQSGISPELMAYLRRSRDTLPELNTPGAPDEQP